jgi:LysW-gamma-L-lysine/LysW-L-ornithine aminotransferase
MTDSPTQYAIRNTQYAEIEAQLESGVVSRRGETVMVSGEGCWMTDSEGNRYLDLTSSQGVAMLGYGHPALSAAIAEQAQRLHACPGFFNNDTRALFLEALIGVMPGHLRHAFVANSGAEAIDGCIKFARLTTGRTGIVAAKGSFHGRTIGAVSLTWNPKYRTPFEPLLPGVSHVKYNDLAELDAAITDETAAVVLEIVQGEGGVNLGEAEFLQGAQALCRERGALLVIDEIQTGFGRTGKWFGFQHFGLEPDMIALAKGVGAGFPMGAIVYTDRVQEALFVGAHGSTFGGNPLASAAGLAAIRAYQDENLIQRAEEAGQRLRARLEEALADCRIVREIRGPGLMIGIDLRTKVGPYLKTLMEEYRVLTLPAGTTVLRLLPPLIINDEEIEIGVAAIAAALGGIERG